MYFTLKKLDIFILCPHLTSKKIMKPIKNIITNLLICWWLLWLFSYLELWIIISINKTSVKMLEITDIDALINIIITFICLGWVFWILNSPIKKILTIVSIPINIITLWVFSLVINMLIFYIFQAFINQQFSPELSIQLGSIIQIFILSCIMSVWITTARKLL